MYIRIFTTLEIKARLLSTTALAIFLCTTPQPANAQSVEVDATENDVSPFPSQNPQQTWPVDGNLFVGNSDKGRLTIKDGGWVDNATGYIGFASGSEGTVNVSGPGSTWKNSGELHVGDNGKGTLIIEDGGAVDSTRVRIGSFAGSEGTVTVKGTGAIWKNTDLYINTGQLTIADGGSVESARGFIGNKFNTEGTVSVSGENATWINSGSLIVGENSKGTLSIADGGTVSAADGRGRINVGGLPPQASGTINIGAAVGETATAPGTLQAAEISFRNGNGTLNFNHTGATTFSAALESSGAGTHTVNHAAGTTILTGDSSAFTGTTTVSGGTLLIGDAAGNGTLGGVVNVGMNGALGGSGTLKGTVTIDGTLSAGNSPGTLTFNNDLTLNAGSTSVFDLNSPGVAGGAGNDLVRVNGALALNGTLDARVAAAGYYRLFEYGGAQSGAFADGTVTGTGGFKPANPNNPDIRYDIPGQINLSVLNSEQTMQFWNGGSGVWQCLRRCWSESRQSS